MIKIQLCAMHSKLHDSLNVKDSTIHFKKNRPVSVLCTYVDCGRYERVTLAQIVSNFSFLVIKANV